MKNWHRLLTRNGFLVEEMEVGVFNCREESYENVAFLLEMLKHAFIEYQYEDGILKMYGEIVEEKEWLKVADYRGRGRTESINIENQPIKFLDTFMAGIIRQLNRLGFKTAHCCDGHERSNPIIGLMKETDLLAVEKLLAAVGANYHVHNGSIVFQDARERLLDFAEQLSTLSADAKVQSVRTIRQQLFYGDLEHCLEIDGASSEEEAIRTYILEQLKPHVDYCTVDPKGNILAQKKYGSGNGTVVLLNAHMDTTERFVEGRKILKDGNWWTSSEGILGADDRAGVAILLSLARWFSVENFNGTIKFIFTVEEEIGLRGARQVGEQFLWGIDAAFVVDRRGAGDIVTSWGSHKQFCDKRFSAFIEETAISRGFNGWKCTPGGRSDTLIWADHGIQSVNLSAGYVNEHTSDEALNVEDCFQTLELIQAVLQEKRVMRRVLNDIQRAETRGIRMVSVDHHRTTRVVIDANHTNTN